MIKIILVFVVGFIEQLMFTAYLLSVNKKQVNKSTILMITYMSVYLFIISYAIKDSNTIPLLISYALSCGAGNYAIMAWEKHKEYKIKRQKKDKRITTKLFQDFYQWLYNEKK